MTDNSGEASDAEKLPINRAFPSNSNTSYNSILGPKKSKEPKKLSFYQPDMRNSHPSPPPIVSQPKSNAELQNDHMSSPNGLSHCPHGLEYLSTLDQLVIEQKVSACEVMCKYEINNKYIVKNNVDQNIFMVAEDTNCCVRNCCGNCRPFDMQILDLYKNEIIHFHRPLACSSCCFPCCLQSIEVSVPPGQFIGRVEQKWSPLFPNYSVKNSNDETVLRIEGPFCTSSCCCTGINFRILMLNGDQVGKITKKWSGCCRECFTDADFFNIHFPMDLDVQVKATLIGACMLIDMMFFEDGCFCT